jgi:type VI protein secretion system component Hcp
MLKPLHTSATFTFTNGEILEDVALLDFTAPQDQGAAALHGGRVFKPIAIVKPIDEASAQLAAAMRQGQRLRTVVITVDRLQYTLIGVFIREVTIRPGRIEEIAMECELIKQQHLLGVPTRVQFMKPF